MQVFMSSESSNDENDKLIIKKWNGGLIKFVIFFKALDDSRDEIQSPMSKRQCKTRVFSSFP